MYPGGRGPRSDPGPNFFGTNRKTGKCRAGENPIVSLDILGEIFIPCDLDIGLRIRDLSLVRRPPADEVCVSGCVDCRNDIHPVGLPRFEAGAHGRTTALCVQLLSRDLCSVQRDHGRQTKPLDQFSTDHNLFSGRHAVWRQSDIHAQAAHSILEPRSGRQRVKATGRISCAGAGHSIAAMSASVRLTDSSGTSDHVRFVPRTDVTKYDASLDVGTKKPRTMPGLSSQSQTTIRTFR